MKIITRAYEYWGVVALEGHSGLAVEHSPWTEPSKKIVQGHPGLGNAQMLRLWDQPVGVAECLEKNLWGMRRWGFGRG